MAVISPERWRQVEELFQAALPLHPHARSALLDRACAGDEALRREVESLLAADNRAADDFLQSDVATLGMQALADEQTGRTEMALLTVGTILDDRYKILAELDAGGMGEVYKAQDLKFTNRLVVVKVLKKTSQNIPWIAKKFLRDEGEAQARVSIPTWQTFWTKAACRAASITWWWSSFQAQRCEKCSTPAQTGRWIFQKRRRSSVRSGAQ